MEAQDSWQLAQGWLQWKAKVQALRGALISRSPDSHVRQLVKDCMTIYKASHIPPPTTDGLLETISGRHSSALEAAFMWIGGWRPTSAITLVYSKLGVDMQKLNGYTGHNDVACLLSKTQLASMDALQHYTCKAEMELSDQLATLQMLIADQSMTEAIGIGSSSSIMSHNIMQGQHLMELKLKTLSSLFRQSNSLRLHTLQELQNLLTPLQAAHCVLAAFELVFALKTLDLKTTAKTEDDVKNQQVLSVPSPSSADAACKPACCQGNHHADGRESPVASCKEATLPDGTEPTVADDEETILPDGQAYADAEENACAYEGGHRTGTEHTDWSSSADCDKPALSPNYNFVHG